MFDSVTLDGVSHGFDQSPQIPPFHIPHQPSPGSTSSINGSHLEPPLPYDALYNQNTSLKTRVSELEVINDLFRGRVTELEQSEQDARREVMVARDCEARAKMDLDQSLSREADLKRRLEDLESQLEAQQDLANGRGGKRLRLSDTESRTSTPLSIAESAC